eukprot:357392-Chlamydomonas_euryale.AAC.55
MSAFKRTSQDLAWDSCSFRLPIACAMPTEHLYHQLVNMTHAAMDAAGPLARLQGMLFMEGEGTAMTQYNREHEPIAETWSQDFTSTLTRLRHDLSMYNPCLPVVLAVQKVGDRERVYPLIGTVRKQQQELKIQNCFKADMEPYEMYPVDFTEIYGEAIGKQSIHFTATGSCDMGVEFAASYIAALNHGQVEECEPVQLPSNM